MRARRARHSSMPIGTTETSTIATRRTSMFSLMNVTLPSA
jgi:hypothetical protein